MITMNFPTKLTVSRIILSIIIVLIMVFPFETIGLDIPVIRFRIDISLKYVVCCILFIIASITDFFDGYLARKNKQVTDLGKVLDAIADKILVNPILIVFASEGIINPIVPVVIVVRDIFVDTIKMQAAKSGKVVQAIPTGKIKTASMMVGIVLLFISDVPFIFYNIRIDLLLVYFATIMSIISMVQYYRMNKKLFKLEPEN